jgi:1-deoxy-D-xylulose-5-phosphate reductoisomerase
MPLQAQPQLRENKRAIAPSSAAAPRRISVLGATGSIGESTLDLIARDPGSYHVVALTGGRNATRLAELAIRHSAELAVIADETQFGTLQAALAGSNTKAAGGTSALEEAASLPADWIMAAIVGSAGLRPTLAAVKQGTCVALANKECLVSAGDLFMQEVAKSEAVLLPVDSEHSAVMQVLMDSSPENIERICLTASGGPFRTWSLEAMTDVEPTQALRHPNWSMGAKVTIDSATLMNKGLELIEAHHLFGVDADRLDVLIHPQSIVHCLVHFCDGSVLAQMSSPDMRTPIAYSLAWPNRMNAPTARLDLAKIAALTFEPPDLGRFPALRIARAALDAGGAAGTTLNAANEVAVDRFLAGCLGFLQIASLVEATLEAAAGLGRPAPATIDEILALDAEARSLAAELSPRFA